MGSKENENREEEVLRLEALRKQHREIDQKINDMLSKPYLTTEEQVEVATLKKLKLKMKDEILELARRLNIDI
jgi:hypothetical protein